MVEEAIEAWETVSLKGTERDENNKLVRSRICQASTTDKEHGGGV